MYKILIVDEERSFIDEITDTINKKIDIAKIVNYALSGSEAVEKAKVMRPDIILLDVKISGINGLEAIKLIKEILPNIHIVIISAYDYFGFLREAIRLDVDDYILKPVNKTNLIDVINDIILKLKQEEELHQKEDTNLIVMNDVTSYAEQNFIYSVLFNKNFISEIDSYQNIINIANSGFVIDIEMISQGISPFKDHKDNYDDLYWCIKKSLQANGCDGIIGPRIGSRVVCYISLKEDSLFTSSKSDMLLISKNIQLDLNRKFGIHSNIGIGSFVLLEEIHSSYEESLRSIAMNEGEDIIHIQDLKEMNIIDYKDYIELQLKLIESIKLAKEEAMDIFCSILQGIEFLNEQYRRNRIIELLVLACYASKTYSKNENEYYDYIDMLEGIKKIESHELDTWALRQFELIIKVTRISNNEKVSNVVSMALKYIEEHYKEELSLEDVSKHVSVSPQYLSKLFKEETNNNFVEYTTKLRIEKAKDLMNSTDKTIKEICYSVGYHDPNYFSRKFKSIVGISPTDYLKGKEVIMY